MRGEGPDWESDLEWSPGIFLRRYEDVLAEVGFVHNCLLVKEGSVTIRCDAVVFEAFGRQYLDSAEGRRGKLQGRWSGRI